MLKKILLVLVAIVVLLIGAVMMQPATYKVTRTTTINAPQNDVYNLIDDFHHWDKWSPWAKIDPKMTTTYSGPAKGTGASYHWVGNNDVGEGNMTITSANPSEQVVIKLEFIKPFASIADTTFRLKPEGAGSTVVTWEMAGDQTFMGKAMTLFASMDSMIGSDFEKGLRQMKATAESAGK